MKSDSRQSESILERIGRNDGIVVPENFFEDFASRMETVLPPRPEAEENTLASAPKTLWGRIRPYVYMAAMFGGIWCMLKMFTLMTGPVADLSIEGNRVLTEALGDENFVYDYIDGQISDRELFDELFDDSISVEDMMPVDETPSDAPGVVGDDMPDMSEDNK